MIACAPREGLFDRIVMPSYFPIDSDDAAPYVEHAVVVADAFGKQVHIQDPGEITVHIIHPEDPS